MVGGRSSCEPTLMGTTTMPISAVKASPDGPQALVIKGKYIHDIKISIRIKETSVSIRNGTKNCDKNDISREETIITRPVYYFAPCPFSYFVEVYII